MIYSRKCDSCWSRDFPIGLVGKMLQSINFMTKSNSNFSTESGNSAEL